MRLQFLIFPWQHASGAMFCKDLKEDLLVVGYHPEVPRPCHTFFCPPMKIVALNAEGDVLFDQVIERHGLVHLPACRYVLETGPKTEYQPFMNTILAIAPDLPLHGAIDSSVRIDSLLFAMMAEAVADIRRVREAHRGEVKPDVQRRKFAAWERGQIVSSAGFLLDFSRAWSLPLGAVRLSRSVLQIEEPYLDELVAASVAGIPWEHEFPNHCIRCGKTGSWHTILNPAPNTPTESAWRYARPENAVPLCHHCVETLEFLRREDLRFDLGWGLWGPRFEALWQWHKALNESRLPDWDLYAYPLWPPEYGGASWEAGSGALAFAEPRPPSDVKRKEQHLSALDRALHSKRFRGRRPGESPLQKLLDFRLESPDGGDL